MTRINDHRARVRPLPKPVRTYQAPQVRERIGAWVEGKTAKLPPPIDTLGGRVWLCRLSDGRDIHLTTSFDPNKRVVAVCDRRGRQLTAEVCLSTGYDRPVGKRELFLIKRRGEILTEGELLPAHLPRILPATPLTPRQIQLRHTRQILAWWKGENPTPPEPYEKTIKDQGRVYLCSMNGFHVLLPIGHAYTGLPVKFSYHQEARSRSVRLEVGGPTQSAWLIKEFWLIRDGEVLLTPVQKSADPAAGRTGPFSSAGPKS